MRTLPVTAYTIGALFNAAVAAEPPPEFVPLYQRGIIPVTSDSNLVSMNHIIETGYAPFSVSQVPQQNYSIDLSRDDALTRSMIEIRERAERVLQNSAVIQSMLSEEEWTKDERAVYEETISNIVTDEVDKVPGLDRYRTPDFEFNTDPTTRNVTLLNDLSEDIEHHTSNVRFDCGVESMIKGIIIQQIENEMLPSVANDGGYKSAMPYFLATNWNHAFIFTPAGNIIEATADPSIAAYQAYIKGPGNTLEQFIKGRYTFDGDSSYNSSRFLNQSEEIWAKNNDKLERQGQLEYGQTIFNKDQLQAMAKNFGGRIFDAGEYGFVMIEKPYGNDRYSLGAFQKQNIGSPAEGYVAISPLYNDPDKAGAKDSDFFLYTDDITHKNYSFSLDSVEEGGAIIFRVQDERSNDLDILTSPHRGQDLLQADTIAGWSSLPGARVLDARDKGFMFSVSHDADKNTYLAVYQERNKGTPEQGYVLVANEIHPDQDLSATLGYTDELTQKTYIFLNGVKDGVQSLRMLEDKGNGTIQLLQSDDRSLDETLPGTPAFQQGPLKFTP